MARTNDEKIWRWLLAYSLGIYHPVSLGVSSIKLNSSLHTVLGTDHTLLMIPFSLLIYTFLSIRDYCEARRFALTLFLIPTLSLIGVKATYLEYLESINLYHYP